MTGKPKTRIEGMSYLLECSHTVLEYCQFRHTAQSIFSSCRNLIGNDVGNIVLLAENGTQNEIQFFSLGGLQCTVDSKLLMSFCGMYKEARRSGKAVCYNDFSMRRWAKHFPKGHMSLENILFAPLKITAKTVGSLCLANKPGGFTEHDVQIASTLAEHASVILVNIRISNYREKRKAEAVSRARPDFLARMSHELRTPLNAIIGFSEVLQEKYFGNLNERQLTYLKHILESGKYLLNLINDILDFFKIEEGKIALELSWVNIRDFLEDCLIIKKEMCLKHGISLDLHVPRDLTKVGIKIDERMFKQVMSILLSNAVKFTPDGGSITLAARHLSNVNGHLQTRDGQIISSPVTHDLELMNHRNYIEISVKDSGIGIAPEHRDKIFEEFYQVENCLNEKTSGTGLGLPLAKRLVEVHDGRIWVESEGEGKGSRFRFALPLKLTGATAVFPEDGKIPKTLTKKVSISKK